MSTPPNTVVLKSLQINNIYALLSSSSDLNATEADAEAEVEAEQTFAFHWSIYVPTHIDKEKGKVKGEIAFVVKKYGDWTLTVQSTSTSAFPPIPNSTICLAQKVGHLTNAVVPRFKAKLKDVLYGDSVNDKPDPGCGNCFEYKMWGEEPPWERCAVCQPEYSSRQWVLTALRSMHAEKGAGTEVSYTGDILVSKGGRWSWVEEVEKAAEEGRKKIEEGSGGATVVNEILDGWKVLGLTRPPGL